MTCRLAGKRHVPPTLPLVGLRLYYTRLRCFYGERRSGGSEAAKPDVRLSSKIFVRSDDSFYQMTLQKSYAKTRRIGLQAVCAYRLDKLSAQTMIKQRIESLFFNKMQLYNARYTKAARGGNFFACRVVSAWNCDC